MKRVSQLPFSEGSKALRNYPYLRRPSAFSQRCLHSSPPNPATVAPITASGPVPAAPVPSAEHVDSRVARRRKQAELLKKGQDLRAVAAGTGGGTAKQKRFWKHVHVKPVDGKLQVHLDTRPLRRPTKEILTVPSHKPHLASAIALEWDLLVSAQQALKHHLIPLTSLVSRALDIHDEDMSDSGEIRANITKTVMRYLDTDSLLCWAEEASPDPPGYEVHESRKKESLRSMQKRTAGEIIGFLTERVWPGVEIVPVLDEGSIMPRSQPQMTRDVIQGWVSGLPAFELAGLERGVLAGKGLLLSVRLLVEWSPELRHLKGDMGGDVFGVEEAARAASLEVDWQTRMWGAVEDTHDVEREDVRRQLGSVVLLVSGEKA
ncbi:ATP12-domain-containing protein [Mollisia scopiformis]|uniref:ATP12-domain-containing protein n=1 Tax=Mollisia scopiformis TaxID=149040 RepID=A0A194XUL8_MOLSC|nr:ATP12-domain-containing protein [Mollisia scopiformis]KUJ23402.1 ATP12-domain-containing protein [Mollisia scopiformis]